MKNKCSNKNKKIPLKIKIEHTFLKHILRKSANVIQFYYTFPFVFNSLILQSSFIQIQQSTQHSVTTHTANCKV